MATIKGVVSEIKPRGSAWNLVINSKTYGAGFSAPACAVGDNVEFETKEVEFKGKTYLNVADGTLKVLPKAEPAPQTNAAVRSASPSSSQTNQQSKSDYWDAKDRKITYLACQKDAIQIVDMALRNDALTLGSTKGKKFGVLVSQVNGVADDLFKRVVDGVYEVVLDADDDDDDSDSVPANEEEDV